MEPLPSHETLPHLNLEPERPPSRRAKSPISIAVVVMFFIFAAAAHWTYAQWSSRQVASRSLSRDPMWSVIAPAFEKSRAFVRVQDTSYWAPRAYGLLTSNSHIATQGAAVELRHPKTGARVIVAPHSVVQFRRTNIKVVSGFAHVYGPMKVQSQLGEKSVAAKDSALVTAYDLSTTLEPRIGSIHDLQVSGRINFTWPKNIASTKATLEFARDPAFQTVLFTAPASGSFNATIDFSDRAPGAWYVRFRDSSGSKLITPAYTVFNLVESETPDQVRRLGRRWLAWRDRGLAAVYRVEFSENETFQKISQSFQVRNHELDLTLVTPGSYFARVTAIGITETEHTSRPIAIQVQDKAEILRAGLELNDPDLKLFARGWKIVLAHDEVSRIREGYVILRDSELRGVKVADELVKDDAARLNVSKNLVFELSRDENFSNPERVRPDSRGELLPPALPLGILYARLRRVETDGSLGAFGPSSRLTTWLPAPLARTPKSSSVTDAEGQTLRGVELKWDLETEVAGYELRVSPSREFDPATTHTIRTSSAFRKIASKSLKEFFWTVTAINEFGQPVSVTSPINEVLELKPKVEKKPKSNLAKNADSDRNPAMIQPLIPMLQQPAEDAVIVGGATATKYGKLTWDFASGKPDQKFEIQIATDGDFVNVIEKSTTKKHEFQLQGDLPEGALFWRVRKAKADAWSRSRKFELVYE